MAIALEEARAGGSRGEVPVGAVVVCGDDLVARSCNRTRELADPTAHAEVLALREAAARAGDWRLTDCVLYVTLEPCAMCAGAIVLARLKALIFGAHDRKAGMCGSLGNLVQDDRLNHRVMIESGVLAEDCGRLLREFFQAKR